MRGSFGGELSRAACASFERISCDGATHLRSGLAREKMRGIYLYIVDVTVPAGWCDDGFRRTTLDFTDTVARFGLGRRTSGQFCSSADSAGTDVLRFLTFAPVRNLWPQTSTKASQGSAPGPKLRGRKRAMLARRASCPSMMLVYCVSWLGRRLTVTVTEAQGRIFRNGKSSRVRLVLLTK